MGRNTELVLQKVSVLIAQLIIDIYVWNHVVPGYKKEKQGQGNAHSFTSSIETTFVRKIWEKSTGRRKHETKSREIILVHNKSLTLSLISAHVWEE